MENHNTICWFDASKTIIVQNYPNNWTWDDFNAMAYQTRLLIKEQDHTVHVLADFSAAGLAVPRGNALMHATKAINLLPPNSGYLLIVSQNNLISALTNLFLKVSPNYSQKIQAFPCLEDAVQFLEQQSLVYLP